MTRGAAVITHQQAGDVNRFEVAQGQACDAGKVAVVPAGVGRADQPAAVPVVSENDPVVPERSNDDSRLRTRGSTGRSRDRSLKAIDLAGRS